MKSLLEARLNQETWKQENALFKNIKIGEETLLSGGSGQGDGLYAAIASPVSLSQPRPQPHRQQGIAIRPNGSMVTLAEIVEYFTAMGLGP